MKHTLSVLLQNKPGVLSRVTGLFCGRNFDIESLGLAETLDPKFSCLTPITNGDNAIIEILRPIAIKEIVRTGKIAIARTRIKR